jgi:hypothetical protein
VPAPPLPTALLVRNYLVLAGRNNLLGVELSNGFDPKSMVLLESPPNPLPQKGATIGSVEVVSRTTDSLELRAQLETPAILVITNNYAQGWRARSLEPNAAQSSYAVMPANWALQAIPLAAGKHHLLLEYRPTSFVIGKWTSILSLIGLVGVASWWLRKRALRV